MTCSRTEPNSPIALLGAFLMAALTVAPVDAQRPLNLDFETAGVAGTGQPWGWTLGWSAFAGASAASFALDSAVRRGGRSSLRIALPDSAPETEPQAIMLMLPSDFALGRELRVTGWTRTAALRGRAMLTLEAWRDRAFAAADTAWIDAASAAIGTAEWTRVELRIRVPAERDIHSIVVAAAIDGSGTVWFDDLELRVDDRPVASLPATAPAPSAADLRWLSAHARPLRTVNPPTSVDDDDSDLARFDEIVGSARIVGLGESTHGTREFFHAKHRLLEHLVRERGFTVFAIEANQFAVERVDRYVRGGVGTARDAMRTMFRVWNTEEMLSLVEWLRSYNASHPDRAVRFVGYDMQDQRTPPDSLRAFLLRTEPALAARVDELLGEYRAQSSTFTPHVPDSTRARWRRQADALWSEVSGRRAAWLARAHTRPDSQAVEWAVQSANLVRQAALLNETLNSPDRDSLMAANLDWALRTLAPDARAVVWAHDVHVSRGGDPALSFNAGEQMGAYLARLYGDGYRAFSLLTYDGAYSATRSFTDHAMIEADAFPAPVGSLEAALHGLSRPPRTVGYTVDLRPARQGDSADWLRIPRSVRHVGYAAYDYGFELSAVLPLEFDGVVFIDHTTPSRLLRRRN